MVAMHKQIVVSLSDLRYISVQCPNCDAVLTLDMTKESAHQDKYGVFFPRVCVACQTTYDSALANVGDLRRAFQALAAVADRVTFRGELESAAA